MRGDDASLLERRQLELSRVGGAGIPQARGLMPITKLVFSFSGSFQVRLATDPDPTNHSPNGPTTPPDGVAPFSRPGEGWTFDYDENRFDRVVRFASPVSLRTDGLLEAWRDVTVTTVKVDRGLGLVSIADPLLGEPVTLGKFVKLDAAAGGGAGQEALKEFEFMVGLGGMFSATELPGAVRILSNMNPPDAMTRQNQYQTVKRGLSGAIRDRARRRVLLDRMNWYSMVFSFMGVIQFTFTFPLFGASFGGVLAEIDAQTRPAPGPKKATPSGAKAPKPQWDLHVECNGFDPDTLVGAVAGSVTGSF